MISKETFIKTLDFLRDQREKFEALRSAAEALSPGEYVNFMPEFTYEAIIIPLLEEAFGVNITETPQYVLNSVSTNTFYVSAIDYFIVDLDFGKKYTPGCYVDVTDNSEIDISTAEKLYDYLMSLNDK